jgi:hypothetical protein
MKASPLLILLAWSITAATPPQDTPDLSKVPAKVMESLKARFPQAEIQKLTEEQEGEITVYDFEFMVNGKKFEADIKGDGSIHNWEKAIASEDLSDPVRKAMEARYPEAMVREVMQITAVHNGKEELEGYEIVLQTVEMKEEEIMVAPDGKILEDTGKESK